MSYQNDTTYREALALLSGRSDLTPITMQLSPEFQMFAFGMAAVAIKDNTGQSVFKARKLASKRGIRLLMKGRGCIFCEREPEAWAAFDKQDGKRVLIYPLCADHTHTPREELTSAVLAAEALIHGAH